MPKFRKKPVEIEARQFKGDFDSGSDIVEWANAGWDREDGPMNPPTTYYYGTLTIRTLEGDMIANKGDWIIKGVQGEFYPCKPDIFAATYEPVA